VCQGGTLLTGAPAAASGRGGGDLSGCAVPATAEAQASAEQEAGARVVRRRQCHGMLLAGCGGWRPVPRRKGGGVGKSRPPREGLESTWGEPGITHCHSRKNAPAASLRAGDVARPLALPPKLFPNDPHSCEYATKEGDRAPLQGRCSANVHLSEGPGRHRSCCYVHARLWRIWSPASEELGRRLPSQFGWVRPIRSAQGAAREGEGC